ncbi:MAG: hypothetical protein E4H37_08735 [Gemmatimonadales bacterium]|jgi:hypothetical protein|nr:MAG: hypothetical protein E4H37_08735 [Gemmatimonadales bacterium]
MMHSWRQRILMLGAALMLVSAAIVAFGVIPLVRVDTFPGAAPDQAVPAFWGNVLLLLLVAAAAVTSSRLGSNRATLRRALAGVPGLLALVLGLLLIDAATAFSGHGPGMHGAVVALWVCVCLDVAAGIGMVGSAFARQG